MRPLLRLALLAASLAGCGGSTEPPEGRALVLVDERLSSRPAVELPTTVRAGTPFDVVVTSVSSPCSAPAGGDVNVTDLVATVTPYETKPTDACVGSVELHAHTFTLRFDRAGAAVVRVRARSTEAAGAETVIERAVTVTSG